MKKKSPQQTKGNNAVKESEASPVIHKPEKLPPLFRPIDWMAFGISLLIVLAAYVWTLAPDLTLEDSGELSVASFYAGIPHPPGYPAWTLYTWLFANLVPFSNIAWRVALASAFAGALSAGFLALMVSRGSSIMMDTIDSLKGISKGWESAICLISGFVASCVLAFSSYIWSQAVIVEVYTPSVLSLVGVLCCLFRWNYAPHQRRYLYLAFFIFGICFTNHQTLILAAMGIEVAIAAANFRMGRNLFLWNTGLYLMGLVLSAQKLIFTDTNPMFFVLFNMVGIASIAAYIFFSTQTKEGPKEYLRDGLLVLFLVFGALIPQLGAFGALLALGALGWCAWLVWEGRKDGMEIFVVFICGLCWLGGAAFYLYMPIAGMTNPPMQWGYPRIVEGFIHALTRGQYEKTAPGDVFGNPLRFIGQLGMLFQNASEEFSYVFLFIALVPFLFFKALKRRERAWLIGLSAIYFCLAVLLMVILNPTPDSTDRSAKALISVFFTASHVPVALMVGYGTSLVAAHMCTHYQGFRKWGLVGGSVSIVLALLTLSQRVVLTMYAEGTKIGIGEVIVGVKQAFQPGQFGLPIFGGLMLLVMSCLFLAGVLIYRNRAPLALSLGIFTMLPLVSVLSNWAESEQRGHLFGYWFGHDMFTPPFDIYPEMAQDSILFGGTDPGRFCPTYMIFCESFIPPRCKPRDPNFDRRDVYIITQNALADGTYLHYIRAHYNKSEQRKLDTPFFQELLRSKKEREKNYETNLLARAASRVLDRPLLSIGEKIETARRERGVYPKEEIYIPSPRDSELCFREYYTDAQRRLEHDQRFPQEPKQIKPGEVVTFTPDGRVQVSGQVAVMAINGLLTKVIFDNNPTNEFYVEESFPLDWMYPHLTPFGIIMKINRQPVPQLTEEILNKDHKFWSDYSERLIGNWITYDTSVQEIAKFAEETFLRHNFAGFKGDRKFVRDDQAQKAFSKLRSSIAGVYAWRLGPSCPRSFAPKTPDERNRLIKETDFAFRQAFAFCPYSPEAVFRYVNFLVTVQQRFEDARIVAETCATLDPFNADVARLVQNLKQATSSQQGPVNNAASSLQQLRNQWAKSPSNLQLGLNLAGALMQLRQNDEAARVLDQVLNSDNADASAVVACAQAFLQLGNMQKLEATLEKLTNITPEAPEAWYDLAWAKVTLGKKQESFIALKTAIELSDTRLKTMPSAKNLRAEAPNDQRFAAIRNLPEFKALVASQ